MKRFFFSTVFSFLIINVCAQNDSSTKKEGSFGGPDQVENQLKSDNKKKEPFFEFGFAQPYFDFKDSLTANTGLSFGLDYSAVYLKSDVSEGTDNASSGMVRLFGSWDLTGRGTKNTGALNFKVEHRHRYGD